jgi:hypothetical protein
MSLLRSKVLTCVAALALLFLTSCIAASRIGVQAGATPGSIAIKIVQCSPTDSVSVTGVSLIRPRAKDASFDERGATILWRIESKGANVTEFIVGQIPPGFTEQVPLHSTPNPDDTLTAVVNAGFLWYDYFQPRALTSTQVIYQGRPVSVSTFVNGARSGGGCSSEPTVGRVALGLIPLLALVTVLGTLVRRNSRRKRAPPVG